MEFKYILFEKSEGVAGITLNRPEKLNAMNLELLDELWAALQDIQEDDETRVVVISGAGKYFSAGTDLKFLSSLTQKSFREDMRKYWNRVFSEIEDMQRLTIAAINGPAIGGGVELALCCDLRYCVEEATFTLPQINFGLLPDAGATVRLPMLIGPAKAKEYIFSGKSMDAITAEDLGLVNHVFSREEFLEEVQKIASEMADKPPLALGMGKQLINRSFRNRDVKSGLEEVVDVQTFLIGTDDYREGMEALKEKRPPRFKGK